MRVLLVEDSPSVREIIAEALSRRYPHCQIDLFADADELIPMIVSQAGNPKFRYDLIVSDVGLLGKASGFDLSKVVDAAFPESAFLFISGMSSLEFLEQSGGGVLDFPYIAKPFSIGEFLQVVEVLLKDKGFNERE